MALYLSVLLTLFNQISLKGSRMLVALYAIDLGATPFSIGHSGVHVRLLSAIARGLRRPRTRSDRRAAADDRRLDRHGDRPAAPGLSADHGDGLTVMLEPPSSTLIIVPSTGEAIVPDR